MDNAERNMTKYSDEDLMALVCERNIKAMKILYERYNKSVFNFILRYTNNREISEDLLQETFTRVWFAAHTFNSTKGAFKSWLFTIGINITRNEMSKKRYDYHHLELEEVTGNEDTSGKTNLEPIQNILEHSDIKDTIAKAIERLDPFLKEVVILKHYQGLKFSEIAKITNTPEGTLKARFHRAMGQLKNLLQRAEF